MALRTWALRGQRGAEPAVGEPVWFRIRAWTMSALAALVLGPCLGDEPPVRFQVSSPEPGVILVDVTVLAPDLRQDADPAQAWHLPAGNLPSISVLGMGRLPFVSLTLEGQGQPCSAQILMLTSDTIPAGPATEGGDALAGLSEGGKYVEEPEWTHGPCPAEPVGVVPVGRFRGTGLVAVQLFPFRYDSKRGILIAHRRMSVKLLGVRHHAGDKDAGGRDSSAPLLRSGPRSWPAMEARAPALRVVVKEEGLYRIPASSFVAAGVDVGSIDPTTLRLTNRGKELPLYVAGERDGRFDPTDYIEFWGTPNRRTWQAVAPDMYADPYVDENTYWVCWGGARGVRLGDEQVVSSSSGPQPVIVPRSFWCTVHVEEDNSFNRLNHLPADSVRDHWFFDSGLQAGTLKEYRFHLPWPDPEAAELAELRAMLYGLSGVPGQAHSVALCVNGFKAGEAQWHGPERRAVVTQAGSGVPPDRLVPGDNLLTVVNNGAPDEVDLVALNWFEVSYGRLYRAEADYIEFGLPKDGPPGFYEFRVDGFSVPEVDVYKLGASKILGAQVALVEDEKEGPSYQISFRDYVSSPSVRYVAVAGAAKKSPLLLELVEPAWLRSTLVGVDYVAIGPDTLLQHPALRELLAHRQGQGLRTLAVPLQAIYDEFNYGIPSPYAVKDFLRCAWEHYAPPKLRYVLLVGDGSWDYKDRHRRGDNLVPVFLRQTIKFGAVASDHWYALVDGDDEVPDLSVGRLPVRNGQELAAMVEKILLYERTSPMDAWRNRLLLVGGNGSVFHQQSEALVAELIPPSFAVERLYTGSTSAPAAFSGGTARLLELLAQGVAYVNFLGHGGGAVWSDNSLFRLEDMGGLSPSVRCPIVSSMTCFTGAFENGGWRSLGEEMVVARGTGAVAFFGASGVGWLYNDYYLLRELIDELLRAGEEATLGEIIARAKIRYLSTYPGNLNYSMVSQYNLLGDPALRTVLPRHSCQLSLTSRVARPGEALQVRGGYEQLSGIAVLELVDQRRATMVSQLCPVRNGAFSASVSLPNEFAGVGALRVYVYDELARKAAHGAVSFAAAELHLDSLWTEPSRPGARDSVAVHTRVFAAREVKEVTWVLASPWADTVQMRPEVLEPCHFITARRLPPCPAGTTVAGTVRVRDVADNLLTRAFSYTVAQGPELFANPATVDLGGVSITELGATVWNTGDVECQGVKVDAFLLDSLSGRDHFLGSTQVDLRPRQSAKATIPGFFGEGWVQVRLVVDPDNRFLEENEENNVADVRLRVDRYVVTPEVGSTLGGTTTDTLFVVPDVSVHVPPGSAARATVVTASALEHVAVREQPDLRPAQRPGPCAWEVKSMAPQAPYPAVIGLRVASDSLAPVAGVFIYESLAQKWVRVPIRHNGAWLYAEVTLPARVAILESYDTTPPRVEVLLDGQLYSDGTYVSPQPLITLLLHDANGIALSPQSLRIALDGQAVPWSSLLLPDSVENGNQVPVSFRPRLAPGSHTCQLEADDCSGNTTGPVELVLTVASGFDLRLLGTYPNPFARQTVFVYELSRWAEDFSLSIYTTSGHLVRRFTGADPLEGQNPLAPGYHEIPWDGTDSEGEEVANGVYFYRLRCSDGERALEHKGVVARLR